MADENLCLTAKCRKKYKEIRERLQALSISDLVDAFRASGASYSRTISELNKKFPKVMGKGKSAFLKPDNPEDVAAFSVFMSEDLGITPSSPYLPIALVVALVPLAGYMVWDFFKRR